MFKYLFILLSFFASVAQSKDVDPTRPLGLSQSQERAEAQQNLILESIIHGDRIHTVVINKQVLKPGEYIGEYRLVAVNDDSVILRSATERLKLYIFSHASAVVK